MNPFYVLVIGPYDQTFFGPFNNYASAEDYCGAVPDNFDAYVYSHTDLASNFKEFGERPIEEPL